MESLDTALVGVEASELPPELAIPASLLSEINSSVEEWRRYQRYSEPTDVTNHPLH